MNSAAGLRLSMLLAAAAACGKVNDMPPSVDGSISDGPPIDAVLGSQNNPARTCAELHVAGLPSAVYWLHDAKGDPPFQAYCEQDINGGGWAMVENSVRRADGATATFWQFTYADRLRQLGTLAVGQNYYNGSLYLIGTEYMDVFVDLQDKTAVAAVMTATGINPSTMQFTMPKLTVGDTSVYTNQFASGWSAQDFDGDADAAGNCSTMFSNVAQHYGGCWAYNLGSDADAPVLDGLVIERERSMRRNLPSGVAMRLT
ncbi:MAG: hypothetical protein E6J91_38455 [Deltaproteobacteria bacterium]|nr:MAG: hypothetical protein E6J91_38455 [Deltaproteobacteria bacterium]